jgi:hypothetical protein
MHVTVAMPSSRAKAGDVALKQKRYDRSWAAKWEVDSREGPQRSLLKMVLRLRREQGQKRRPTCTQTSGKTLGITLPPLRDAVQLDSVARCALERTDISH